MIEKAFNWGNARITMIEIDREMEYILMHFKVPYITCEGSEGFPK